MDVKLSEPVDQIAAGERFTLGRYRILLFIVLLCAALGSLALGCIKALKFGVDFQWEGAVLLAHHIDPWATDLRSFHVAHLSPPNYLHELYILFLPLTGLSFHSALLIWCVLNIVLSFFIVVCLSELYALPRTTAAVFLCLLWLSMAFRNTLQTGQFSLVELAIFCALFYTSTVVSKGVLLGLSYAKYSFSPVLFLFFLFRRKTRLLLVSLVVPVVGFLVTWYLLKGAQPLRLAVEPLLVSRIGVSPGYGDVMSLIDRLLGGGSTENTITKTSYAVALIGSGLYAFRLAKRQFTVRAEMALIVMATLLLFKHLVYDYVFLIVPLAYALRATPRAKHFTYLLVFLFWYGWRLGGWANHALLPLPLQAINAALMIAGLVLLDRNAMREIKKASSNDGAATIGTSLAADESTSASGCN